MLTSMIVAMDKNNAIGKKNQLPWHLSDDLQMFKRVTSSHAILMGRRTFDSIGKVLPNRRNFILTRNKNLKIDGAHIIHSIDEAYEQCKSMGIEQLFIIGGGKIFLEFLPLADLLYISEVDADIKDADTFFPRIDFSQYYKIYTQSYSANDKNDYDFQLNILRKK